MVFKTHEYQNKDTVIVDRNSRRKLGQFKNGLFETEDEWLIKKMSKYYESVETKKGRARKCLQTDREV